ncbi:MAG: HAMP domain-containing sensor histidine kinase, partial [Pseudomonadota bacterium]
RQGIGLFPKFLILAVLLCLAFAADVVATGLGLRVLERDVAGPVARIQDTLLGLVRIRAEIRTLSDEMATDGKDAEVFENARARMLDAFDLISSTENNETGIGMLAADTLRQRIESLDRAGADPQSDLQGLLRFVDRVEAQTVADAAVTLEAGQRLRHQVAYMIVLSAALTLVAVLGSIAFVRRRVLHPIRDLRRGVQHYAEGEFDHRVPIATSDELGVLADELNTMAGRIDDLQRQRIEDERLAAIGEMTRRIVHNLRSPLTGIRALAEMTRSELDESSELNEVQSRIIASVDRFEGWLRDLLASTSPLEIHRMNVDLSNWLRDVVAAHHGTLESRGISFETSIEREDLRARIDPRHLQHAMSSILANAIDAAGPDGSIEIRVERSEGERPEIVIATSDSGPGIAPEDRERVLSPYVTTKANGTGIGLAFSKSIAEAHDGCIVIADAEKPFSGARIELRIPV